MNRRANWSWKSPDRVFTQHITFLYQQQNPPLNPGKDPNPGFFRYAASTCEQPMREKKPGAASHARSKRYIIELFDASVR
jgi:hypothetical protein